MIARRSSLLRQLVWAATLATGFGTALVFARDLARHLDSRCMAGRERPASYEKLVVRSDGTPLIQSIPARQSVR